MAAASLMQDPQDAIIGETLGGDITIWNDGAARLFGYTAEEVVGRSASILSVVVPASRDAPPLVERVKRGECISSFEAEMISKNGTIVATLITLSPVRDGLEEIVGLLRIVRPAHVSAAEVAALRRSEIGRQALEREVIHLARWSAMGQMAIVLAHELNQPLTAIVSYLTSARRLLRNEEKSDLSVLASAMERANEQAKRAAKIIGHLRSFVSQGEAERQYVPIAAAIIDASELALIAARQADVVVDFQLGEDGTVLVDRVQIQQVIFNLMRNAVEAMAETPSRELRVSTARDGDYIRVSVSDSGSGISPEILVRLFQPFVTTKPDGMGVGLSICRAIINAHGGELWYEDAFPTGATFHFKLPLATDTDG